jgi:hypothetical protein
MATPHEKRPMPRSLKATLIIGGVLLFLAGAAVVAAYTWWQTKGAAVVATLGEGSRFGKGKSRQDCVTEAVLRLKRGSSLIGFTEEIKGELFLEECLRVASPVAGFCDGIPPKSDVDKTTAWRDETARRYGLEGNLRRGLVAEIQDFCNAQAGVR